MRGPRGTAGALASAVDRRSGYVLVAKLASTTATATREALVARFQTIPRAARRTLTCDNGTEFGEVTLLERALGMPVYFARPYHSWERGTNENTNGLLRQYFPKRRSLARVTQREVDRIARVLNNRPRKRLGYRTLAEVFWGYALRTLI